ncbi:MAG TPA: murein biosynthesis integral membrane protein MurJ [Acidimicrobiia bacterium]|nr:murein biosynthesis integral membrane protein MurJ [Acidimicrobiia bacterium]
MTATTDGDDGSRAGLARSSAAVAAGTLLSRVTGLLRVVVLAAAIGKASLADTYNLANITPNIVYELLVGGVLAATLVPVFVDLLERRDERSTAAVFTVTMTSLTLFTVATIALSPLLARLFVLHEHGPDRAAQLHVLTVLILCFVPQMIFYGFTTLASALLNARRRFVAAAFAPVVNNVVVIAVLLVFVARTSDRHGSITDVARVRSDLGLLLLLGIGTTVGIVAMALVLVPAVVRAGVRLRFVLSWRDPAIRTILRLSGWTAGYVVTNQLAQLFVLVLANNSSGNVSAYVYAFTFYVVPHGLLAVSIMTTMTPNLARRVRAGDPEGLRREFGLGLRYIVVLVLPASVLFAVLAQPMLAVIVRHQFSAHDAVVTADTLQAFALSLVPFSVYLYVMRAFYAMQDTRTPFVLNAFENGLNVVLALVLFPRFGVQGLALAWSGAYTLAAVGALVVLRRRIGGVPDADAARSTFRAAIAALALAVVAAPLAGAIGRSSPGTAFLATVAAGAAGALVYVVVLVALRSDELASLVRLVRRRDSASPGVER